jgi:hypothetical protein
VSQPYWLEHTMTTGNFNVKDQKLIGKAQNDPAYIIKAALSVMGEKMVFDIPVMNRVVDPAVGEFFHPVLIVPANTLSDQPAPLLINTANNKNATRPSIKPMPPVIRSIEYEHIPTLTYFTEAKQKVIEVDLKTTGKNIGYIKGAGDKVPGMIELMGYQSRHHTG